jgi:SAM-dependent methyltransferase
VVTPHRLDGPVGRPVVDADDAHGWLGHLLERLKAALGVLAAVPGKDDRVPVGVSHPGLAGGLTAHGGGRNPSSLPDRTIAGALSCPICGARSVPDTVFSPSSLLRCRACDFAFLPGTPDPRLHREAYFADYDGEDYRAGERARRFESRRRLDLLARHLPPPARLLEIGGAAGFFLDEARRRGYEGAGVELNEEMAAYAREALGLDVEAARLEDVELAEQSFDGVCAFHVLEHLPAPAKALAAIRAALRPGGILLVEVPNASSQVARRQGGRWHALKLPHHVGHYGPRSMIALLDGAGLEVVAIDSVPFAHYAAPRALGRPVRGAVALREVVRSRASVPPWRHPNGHQLLRALARRPE